MNHRALVSIAAALAVALAVTAASAMYVPTYPRYLYGDGDVVAIRVNSLRSASELVPLNFYRMPYCAPKVIEPVQESLGEILFGDNMLSSAYSVRMLRNVTCARVTPCQDNNADQVKAAIDDVERLIEEGYRGHMSIDNLPGYNPGKFMFNGNCNQQITVDEQSLFRRGFAIGVPKKCLGTTLLNNHLEFTVKYHVSEPDAPTKKYTIVGFTITPQSARFTGDGSDCNDLFRAPSELVEGSVKPLKIADVRSGASRVFWTYSVKWVESPVRWITRWDAYLSTSFADKNARVHWEYIIVATALALVISSMVTFLLLRALKLDCAKINSDDPDEVQENVGWKYVHADVFRKPEYLNVLAMLIGNGTQLIGTVAVCLVIGLFGFLSPANRGGLLTTAVLMFVLMSFPSGYVCAMVQKTFDVKEWKTIFGCAVLFPGELFVFWVFQDVISWHLGATNAVPLGTFAGLFVLWMVISVPLTVLGASFAWHQDKIAFPTKTNDLAREIPVQRWYYTAPFTLFVPGLVPFMIVFMELRFIFSSIWLGYVYYVFGFLSITIVLWMYTVALTAICCCYYQLAYEDWRWWWRSFFVPSGSGVYVLLYCIYFYATALNVQSTAGTFLYFGYSILFVCAYVLVAGTIGVSACLLFTRKIYGSIRIE
jgi:transmembrane 9 superfamily protein 2/4